MSNTSDQPHPTATPQDVLDWGMQGAADPQRARLQALSVAAGTLAAARGDAMLVSMNVDANRVRVTVHQDRALAAWCVENGGAVDRHAQHGHATITTLRWGPVDVDVVDWRTDAELVAYARDLADRVPVESGGSALRIALEAATVRQKYAWSTGPSTRDLVLPLDVARAACEGEAGLEDTVFVYLDPNTARVDLEGLLRRVRA